MSRRCCLPIKRYFTEAIFSAPLKCFLPEKAAQSLVFSVALGEQPNWSASGVVRALPRGCLELGVELDRSLEMFFSELGHSELLQPEADHPMVKRILGSKLVGLVFVRSRLLVSG